jgi:ATP/maltotriose-dependent transcriptional regulator MalT
VTALVNELAAGPGPDEVLLVLDDYHLADAEPVHQSVAFLLEHLPPGLQVVVSGRADPPLPLARLRARGQLAELRAGDLRFTPAEAAALLGELAGPDLPPAAAEALAAGLQLAGLSLRGHADPNGFVADFSGSHRFVLDYLTDEVLIGQPAPVRAFLLETSVLERLSAELCDAVTGGTDSQTMLQDIERAGLFLVPLDEVRGWWRYHHLFADLLRARLLAEQSGRVPALHRAAAAWCEEHDLADDAVRHALAAGDADWAARLVERHVGPLLGRGEGATLRRWLSAVPAEALRKRPRLYLAQAVGAAMSFQVDALWGAGLDPDDEPDYPQEPVYLVLARVLLAQHRPGPALTMLSRLLAAAASQGRTGSIIEIQALRALALAAGSHRAGALDALTEAVTLASRHGYLGVLADEGAPMRALLAELPAARLQRARPIDPGYLAALTRACPGADDSAPDTVPPRRGGAAPQGLVEPLTDREMEVLRLLADGQSNQRIARELFVTLDTVKKHVTHVLSKLGAANRTEAAARARQLGLIP